MTSIKQVVTPQFRGTWQDRLDGFDLLNFPFRGMRVLDVGCNMGIVGYEICKQHPSYYHGIEVQAAHAALASMIFAAVPVPSEITCADLAYDRRSLHNHYDVALVLAVTQHVRKQHGAAKVDTVANDILGRVDNVIYRGTDQDWFTAVASIHGFIPVHVCGSTNLRPLVYFRKN